MPGTLYVVATPIGNLKDITFRAVETLKSADVIAAEDTGSALKLVHHFSLAPQKIIQYSENTHRKKMPEIVSVLESGRSVALISKAGTPLVSDPGGRLVTEVAARGIRIVPVPGPTAAAAALSACPLGISRYIFAGFLPRKKGKARRMLADFKETGDGLPVVIYESPHRVKDTLGLVAETYGPETAVFIGRELTKLHEECVTGTAAALQARFEASGALGEIVLVIGPGRCEVTADEE